jgi:hypothetical protein
MWLLWPLGPGGTVEEGGNDGFWGDDSSTLTYGLPLAPDRQPELAEVGATSNATMRTGASVSEQDEGPADEGQRERGETVAVAEGLSAMTQTPAVGNGARSG